MTSQLWLWIGFNVFVFALLFSYFAVPPVYRHKVLFWAPGAYRLPD